MPTIFNPDATNEILEFDGLKYLVMDDALQNPDSFRSYASELKRTIQSRNSPIGYKLYPDRKDFEQRYPGYTGELEEIIESQLGENLRNFYGIDQKTKMQLKGPLYNCVCQLPYFPPHVDSIGHVASFIYLMPDELCSGGTGIYRHIPTGKLL